MFDRRRYMGEHRDLIAEWPIRTGEFLINTRELGRQLAGGDIAHPGHGHPYLLVISCCISGCPIAGLIASNRPLALISRATWRVAASATNVSCVAVVTRATP